LSIGDKLNEKENAASPAHAFLSLHYLCFICRWVSISMHNETIRV